ncbi:hypothetical protein GQ42DRAFT_162216 [Ramicandelaber brevisporus]|nr:hypothetical protein GQ42DRAFT_162216 [Ramicandelaber brevisporus]
MGFFGNSKRNSVNMLIINPMGSFCPFPQYTTEPSKRHIPAIIVAINLSKSSMKTLIGRVNKFYYYNEGNSMIKQNSANNSNTLLCQQDFMVCSTCQMDQVILSGFKKNYLNYEQCQTIVEKCEGIFDPQITLDSKALYYITAKKVNSFCLSLLAENIANRLGYPRCYSRVQGLKSFPYTFIIVEDTNSRVMRRITELTDKVTKHATVIVEERKIENAKQEKERRKRLTDDDDDEC